MTSKKSQRRAMKSSEDSAGDRRSGSVGERPALAGSRDSDGRRTESDPAVSKGEDRSSPLGGEEE